MCAVILFGVERNSKPFALLLLEACSQVKQNMLKLSQTR